MDLFLCGYKRDLCAYLRDSCARDIMEMAGGGKRRSGKQDRRTGTRERRGQGCVGKGLRGWSGSLVLGGASGVHRRAQVTCLSVLACIHTPRVHMSTRLRARSFFTLQQFPGGEFRPQNRRRCSLRPPRHVTPVNICVSLSGTFSRHHFSPFQKSCRV